MNHPAWLARVKVIHRHRRDSRLICLRIEFVKVLIGFSSYLRQWVGGAIQSHGRARRLRRWRTRGFFGLCRLRCQTGKTITRTCVLKLKSGDKRLNWISGAGRATNSPTGPFAPISQILATGALAVALGAPGPALGDALPGGDQDTTSTNFVAESHLDAIIAAPRFVEFLAHDSMVALTDLTLAPIERREHMRQIFYRSFATTNIARAVLGRYWFTATDAEKDEFLDVLGRYVAVVVVDNFSNGRFVIFSTSQAERPGRDEAFYDVATVLTSDSFSSPVVWTIEIVDGELKVLDLVISGQSFIMGQRDRFARILRRNDGSMAALIEAIRPTF